MAVGTKKFTLGNFIPPIFGEKFICIYFVTLCSWIFVVKVECAVVTLESTPLTFTTKFIDQFNLGKPSAFGYSTRVADSSFTGSSLGLLRWWIFYLFLAVLTGVHRLAYSANLFIF